MIFILCSIVNCPSTIVQATMIHYSWVSPSFSDAALQLTLIALTYTEIILKLKRLIIWNLQSPHITPQKNWEYSCLRCSILSKIIYSLSGPHPPQFVGFSLPRLNSRHFLLANCTPWWWSMSWKDCNRHKFRHRNIKCGLHLEFWKECSKWSMHDITDVYKWVDVDVFW